MGILIYIEGDPEVISVRFIEGQDVQVEVDPSIKILSGLPLQQLKPVVFQFPNEDEPEYLWVHLPDDDVDLAVGISTDGLRWIYAPCDPKPRWDRITAEET